MDLFLDKVRRLETRSIKANLLSMHCILLAILVLEMSQKTEQAAIKGVIGLHQT